MPPELLASYEEIARRSDSVRAICARFEVRVKKNTDLEKILQLASNAPLLAEDPLNHLELCHAHRVLGAILACENEPELTEPLRRIATKPLARTWLEQSAGKDALFELELFQHIRQRGLEARLGEPDIIVSLPFGEYFVACKTINSYRALEGQLRKGYHQVRARGYGCVAFNVGLHILTERDEPVPAQSGAELANWIEPPLRDFYLGEHSLNKRLIKGPLDGLLFQVSCLAQVAESGSDMNIFTHTSYHAPSRVQQLEAQERFESFRLSME